MPRTCIIDEIFYANTARLSLLLPLSENFYQILSGKLATSRSVAKDIASLIQTASLDKVRHLHTIPGKKTA